MAHGVGPCKGCFKSQLETSITEGYCRRTVDCLTLSVISLVTYGLSVQPSWCIGMDKKDEYEYQNGHSLGQAPRNMSEENKVRNSEFFCVKLQWEEVEMT